MSSSLILKRIGNFTITPTSPFDFKSTMFKPSHFHSQLVRFLNNKLYQTIKFNKSIYGLVINSTEHQVCVEVYGDKLNPETLDCLKREINWRYNLSSNIQEFIQKFKDDEYLSKPIRRLCGMRPSCSYSLYEFLIVATMLQNATVKRSISMLDTMLKKYGQGVEFDGVALIAMWDSESIVNTPEDQLRELKIGYRAKNIKRISEVFTDGSINEVLLRKEDKDKVIEALIGIYGVGPQTASYILFEYFHYYDTLDFLSPWESKIFSMVFYGKKDLPPAKTIELLKNRYGDWRALAAHYIFEDLFWRRQKEPLPWLEDEIRD